MLVGRSGIPEEDCQNSQCFHTHIEVASGLDDNVEMEAVWGGGVTSEGDPLGHTHMCVSGVCV